ncbi:site-specific DNA-methyltransferase [Hymenobacter ruricola]|uniref:site-specific DNA-methyltransferase (adenine-specific) n=1 Tax=Hymenobacter ruricola TaxID=2791023 RepID=A0ABS0I6C8_9BACT|nr:site-specific DNA-methyltransferase [Hymenobacter ruricola]MBF9222519.1 site-specific DNA-methyltransferase [Hymenobacter ruricola]
MNPISALSAASAAPPSAPTAQSYGLVWEDKPEAAEETLRRFLPVLEEVPARAVLAADADAPQHALIEGDNLHALTVLGYTHEAKVDVIYIDPPYNTGNQDFSYNDSFVDPDDGFRHSKWLSFMNRRLKLAKALLKPTGVIFISIDDHEQAALKLLCDQVFGEHNFVGNVCWFKKRKGSFLANELVSLTEYVLIYKNSQPLKLFGGLPDNSESQPIIKRTNTVKQLTFPANLVKTKLPDGTYEPGVYGDGTSASRLLTDIQVQGGIIRNSFVLEAPFVWSQAYLDEEIRNHTEVLINTLNLQPRVIRTNNESIKAFPSFIDGREIGATNEDAYELLKNIFHTDRPFSYSKPVNLLKMLIQAASYQRPDAVVLDFFAGSGTALHATMQLNAEDGGRRRCVLVTNNENNIAEEITYERNRRVIQGYTSLKGVAVPGLTNNSLRYFRCVAPVPRTPTLRHKRELVRRATDLLCLKENCFQALPTPAGADFRAFAGPTGHLVIVYDDLAVEEAAAFVAALPEPTLHAQRLTLNSPPCAVYVFAAASYAYEDEFAAVAARIRLSALPEALYRAWQHLLPELRVESEELRVAAPAAVPLLPAPFETAADPAPVAAPPIVPRPEPAPHIVDKRGNLMLF